MIEEYTANGSRDFQQRYKDTYGWYITDKGNKVFVKLSEVGTTALKFVDAKENVYTALADKGNRFEFIPLERGLFNSASEDAVVYCQRVPARQWRRGIHQQNTSLTKIGGAYNLEVNFKSLLDIMEAHANKVYVNQWKQGGRHTAAFNPMFGVVNRALYNYNRIIGSLDKKRIVLDNSLFLQEVMDIVQEYDLKLEVHTK